MMEKITRRLFLRSTAAAGAALTAVTAPIIANAAQQEAPELLKLQADLPAAVTEYQDAERQRIAARAMFNSIAPTVPADLVAEGPDADRFLSEREVDAEYNEVWPVNSTGGIAGPPRRIYSSDAIQRCCYPVHNNIKSEYGDRWRRIRDMAAEFEAAQETAREEAGVHAAMKRHCSAIDRLRRMASDAAEIVPHSLTGLVIKAQVFSAYAACGGEAKAWAVSYQRQLSSDILAVFGEAR